MGSKVGWVGAAGTQTVVWGQVPPHSNQASELGAGFPLKSGVWGRDAQLWTPGFWTWNSSTWRVGVWSFGASKKPGVRLFRLLYCFSQTTPQ